MALTFPARSWTSLFSLRPECGAPISREHRSAKRRFIALTARVRIFPTPTFQEPRCTDAYFETARLRALRSKPRTCSKFPGQKAWTFQRRVNQPDRRLLALGFPEPAVRGRAYEWVLIRLLCYERTHRTYRRSEHDPRF